MTNCCSLFQHCSLVLCLFCLQQVPLGAADDWPRDGERVAVVGNGTAERMNLYGHVETSFHLATSNRPTMFRNFAWPADEVANQQRPSNYTTIDNPLDVYSPTTLICMFGMNESFQGTSEEAIQGFVSQYRDYLQSQRQRFQDDALGPRFVIVSPIAFESSNDPLQPTGLQENANLRAYSSAIERMCREDGLPFVDLFTPTSDAFGAEPGLQYTVNGLTPNEQGEQLMAKWITKALFPAANVPKAGSDKYELVRKWINDKAWFHQQDYRMLNGWYVYGGRRTWDTETFPTEYRKIRKMVAVRDQYVWDLVDEKEVPAEPDDSQTGEVFEPATMFGTRDDNFRQFREPTELVYPTPEESIEMMTVPEGFRVELFASEREFPELANPNQIAFDAKGRLWVSCMPNYPQWQPGAERPSDRLLILEDTDNDGKADKCTTFYDKLICPTGFEFWNGGVLVVDEPRILFLKDTDGDDQADLVEPLLDGIATDDTHHTVGAWEFSNDGKLYMLEGIQLSTTLETPWGPFRNKYTGGAYIWDLRTHKMSHFITPGYGNPWCLIFDEWGNGIVGDGTNARQHWTSPLAGKEVPSRKTLTPVFDNQGMRPAVGNEFLFSRHFPEDVQGQFIYACVINMHGLPRFTVRDGEGAGFDGERIADLLSSTDMVFRPVDPKIGPDGALWFGDWCNALIGHMQYSQRDPNRDHIHGRVYRLVNENKPLLETVDYSTQSNEQLLDALTIPEWRTRYRIRRILRDRDVEEVLAAAAKWAAGTDGPRNWCEVLWLQQHHHRVDAKLVERIYASEDFHARAAVVRMAGDEIGYLDESMDILAKGVQDSHPRVRLEAIRGLSFVDSDEALALALQVSEQPMDYWIEYTLEHTLQAFEGRWKNRLQDAELAALLGEDRMNYLIRHSRMTGPGGAAVKPLEVADNVDEAIGKRKAAIRRLAEISGGNAKRGEAVYVQVCSSCHQIGELGKKFGPDLSMIGSRMSLEEIMTSIILPNEQISKGYETEMVVTIDGEVLTGFILEETDEVLSLGVANGKREDVVKEDIDARKPMKASSMPEGLAKTIAPIEFLDLVEFLKMQTGVKRVSKGEFKGIELLTDVPLESKDQLVELSRNAMIRLGDGFERKNQWNQKHDMVFQPNHGAGFDFAFHSIHDFDSPFIDIQLVETGTPKLLKLENRTDSQFHSRAKNMTVSVSADGKSFDRVWKTDEALGVYWIELPTDASIRFLRVGIEGKGTFHLNRITVFGDPVN